MINFEKIGNIEKVSFSVNKINALITEEIKEQVLKVLDQQHVKLVIDLKGVEYIDSSGFGALLYILRECRNSYGSMKLLYPEPAVSRLLETLNLHTVFEVFSDQDECLKSFS
jgi:anti-sigma B factor antagonist